MVRTLYAWARAHLSSFEVILGVGFLAAVAVTAMGGRNGQVGFVLLMCASALVLTLAPAPLRRSATTLSVFVHELGHGLAAWLTGGRFRRFFAHVAGGEADVRGGSAVVIDLAGYVGTMLAGCAALMASTQQTVAPWVLLGAAVLLGVTSVVKGADGETCWHGLQFAAALAVPALIPGVPWGAVVVLNLLGVVLLWDGWCALRTVNTVARESPGEGTDADLLAKTAGFKGPVLAARVILVIGVLVGLAGVASALVVAG